MRLELTGRHVSVSSTLRRLVQQQLARLDRVLNDSAISCQTVLTQEKYRHHVEIALHARGERSSSMRLVLSPLARFVRFYVLRAGFLDGVAGLVHIAIGAFASFCKYAKLRALEQTERAR